MPSSTRVVGGLACSADIPPGGFDLVIANASVMLAENTLGWKDRVHLVYAQLRVALRHTAPGGSLVISLQARPFDWNVDILETLRQCFRTLTAVKPGFQRRRSITYIVCQDCIASNETRQTFLRRFEAGIQYLGHAGKTKLSSVLEIACLQSCDQIHPRTHLMARRVCPVFRGSWTRDSWIPRLAHTSHPCWVLYGYGSSKGYGSTTG